MAGEPSVTTSRRRSDPAVGAATHGRPDSPSADGRNGPSRDGADVRLLPRDATAMAALFSNHLAYAALEDPLGVFLREIADIRSCKGVALAIEHYGGTGKYLVVHALVDLSGVFEGRSNNDPSKTRMEKAFSRMSRSLKDAPFRLALMYRHTPAWPASGFDVGIQEPVAALSEVEVLLGADVPDSTEYIEVAIAAEQLYGAQSITGSWLPDWH